MVYGLIAIFARMSRWIAKAIVQKTISFLPFSNRINYFFQKYVTKGIILTEDLFLQKLEHGRDHITHFKKYSSTPVSSVALELGTGWYPIVPIGLFLCGFNRIITIDQSSLLREENVRKVIEFFLKYHQQRRLVELLPYYLEDRVIHLRKTMEKEGNGLAELLRELNIEIIVGDAGQSGLPAGSVDFFLSNNTFEHIPPPVIVHILKEFRRVAQPTAIMSHFIDLTDHFAHFDKSISAFNFLRFSESQWKWINNGVQYLNRLRIDEFLKIHSETGFEIIEREDLYADPKNLDKLPVHKDFSHLNRQDLLVSHTWLVSKPV